MDISSWQSTWYFIFFFASLMFYCTVVAFKGVGDVVAMISKMIEGRRQ